MSASLSGARVLVTGARGFVGQHLVRSLVAEGVDVHGTSRAEQAAATDGLKWWCCDLTDQAAVRGIFAKLRPDYVCHLSSLADGRRDRALVIPILQSETVAAVNVLEAAAGAGTQRVIMPSSLEEPGPGEAPSSPYAAAKAASQLYARLYHGLYGVPMVMARIFMGYGPGQSEWKVIPQTARCLLRGEAPVIHSPDRSLDWIYITDVVAGLQAVLRAPAIEGETIDLGSGRLTTIRDLVELLRHLINPAIQPTYGTVLARGRAESGAADLARTARQIDWAPKVGLSEGLQRLISAMQQDKIG